MNLEAKLANLGKAISAEEQADLGLSPRSGSADAVVKDKKVDIKTTRHRSGRLLATLKANPDVDIYVLAIIDEGKVVFPGYALKSELIQDANLKDLGHGKGYAMEQSQLRKFQ